MSRSFEARQLRLAYLSALGVICLLLLIGQLLSQTTLAATLAAQETATLLHGQELRVQRLRQNSVLLLGPDAHAPLVAQINADLVPWETTHALLTASTDRFSVLQARLYQHTQNAYTVIDTALHTLLRQEQMAYPTPAARRHAEIPLITQVFYQATSDVHDLELIYQQVNAAASARAQQARLIEALLCVSILVTLGIEYHFIVRPAILAAGAPLIDP